MMKEPEGTKTSVSVPYFWIGAGALILLHAVLVSWQISRPFYGLHSWAQASGAWVGRTHVVYGLGYTKGVSTWAVGHPPTDEPRRYLNHPQLGGLVNAAEMAVFGVNEAATRIARTIAGIISLIIFFRLLKGLMDKWTALLSGFIYVLFPLTAYFGGGGWFYVLMFLGLYCYLVLIGALADAPPARTRHKVGLAVTLFLMLQLSWAGFFYAFAIGSHYVLFECLRRRRLNWGLLAILVFAPLASCAITFTIMAGGYGWDVNKIYELYKWRASKGEVGVFSWGLWLSQFWQKAVTNFTMPALFATGGYLLFAGIYGIARLFIALRSEPSRKKKKKEAQVSLFARWRFPQLWLFAMPGVLLLLVFRGLVWRHEYWQRPLAVLIAIAAALLAMLIADLLRRISKHLAIAWVVVFIGGYAALAGLGIHHYYGIRWRPAVEIEMFKMLSEKIPPDKYLLSYDPYMTDQHESKGAFYRPEIAWYLDREIVPARSWKLEEIQEFATTGKYPYYLVPEPTPFSRDTREMLYALQSPKLDPARRQSLERMAKQAASKEYMQWQAFLESLKKTYQYQRIEGVDGELRKPYPLAKEEIFYRAGMQAQLIFDLNSPAQAENSRQ